MIGGATRGSGGGALGRHLSNEAKNEQVTPLEGRGLIARDARDQVAELTEMGAHARTRTPLYHVHADPPADCPWSDDERARYWQRFEAEFGLEDRPFAAVMHRKDGREHEHRVYLRIRDDGTAIRLDHDHARREKLNRLFELERGDALTPGAHNRAVIAAMEREGRHEAAQAMREAGLDTMERPRAGTTPQQRAQAERTGVDPRAVGAAALVAWKASDGGRAFAAALEERGLRLAQGDRKPVIVDAEGGAHPLARVLGKESKAAGEERISAADVADRLSGLDLPRHDPAPGRRPLDEAPQPVDAGRAPTVPQGESLATEAAAPSAANPIPKEQAPPTAPEPVPEAPASTAGESAPVEAAAPEPAPTGEGTTPAAPAGAPQGGASGAAPSVGGGGGGAEAPDSDTIAPLDPSRPDDVARFLRDFARVMQRCAAKAAASEGKKGGPSNGGQQDGKWLQDWLEHLGRVAEQAQRDGRRLEARDALAQARADRAAWAAVVGRPNQAGTRGHGGPRAGGGGAPGRARPEGTLARPVGDAPGGRDGRGPARPAGAAGPTAEGRGEPARPDPRAPRADRRSADPHGAAAGRARIRTRRALCGLAAAAAPRADRLARLTAALATAPSVASLAREAIQADRQRTCAVLATAPWPDPRSRSAESVRGELRDAVFDRQRAAERTAEAAAEQASEARRSLRLLDRVFTTAATAAARQAAAEADRLREAAELGRETTRDDVRAAEERAPHLAQARQRQQAEWDRRPDVVDAARRDEANRLIEHRLAAGDRALLARVASGNLESAQRQVLEEERRRQEDIRRQREEQLRREHEERMRGYTPSRAPTPGGRPTPGPQR